VNLTTNIHQYEERADDAAGMRLANGLEGGKEQDEMGGDTAKARQDVQSLAKGIAQLSH
jgi:hypothetical protein